MRPAPRPEPSITPDTAFWWEGLQGGELRIQRCGGCSRLRHPPEPACPACGALGWDWILPEGRGTVHSFVVVHEPQLEGLPTPYVVALVDLVEGVRLVTNLVDVDPAEVEIEMPVAATIVDFGGRHLPVFTAAAP